MSSKGSLILAVAFVVCCAASFGAGWSIQGTRWKADVDTIQGNHARTLKAQSDKALEDYRRMEKAKDEAIQKHKREAEENRLAADAAKRTADGLRRDLRKVPDLIATATHSALAEYATATSGLLGNCTEEYQRMAETAQRHATDVRALLNAWPSSDEHAP